MATQRPPPRASQPGQPQPAGETELRPRTSLARAARRGLGSLCARRPALSRPAAPRGARPARHASVPGGGGRGRAEGHREGRGSPVAGRRLSGLALHLGRADELPGSAGPGSGLGRSRGGGERGGAGRGGRRGAHGGRRGGRRRARGAPPGSACTAGGRSAPLAAARRNDAPAPGCSCGLRRLSGRASSVVPITLRSSSVAEPARPPSWILSVERRGLSPTLRPITPRGTHTFPPQLCMRRIAAPRSTPPGQPRALSSQAPRKSQLLGWLETTQYPGLRPGLNIPASPLPFPESRCRTRRRCAKPQPSPSNAQVLHRHPRPPAAPPLSPRKALAPAEAAVRAAPPIPEAAS
ncbi:5E5 antigen-like [Ochotona curzoniae]|uniref:5E5 antigen-like n=1 Tax=Ochotona curzoniae TaxID=130825 RepID=UPI001B34AF84|nr:5E5 antigen-like [Ochotona curzoniae]